MYLSSRTPKVSLYATAHRKFKSPHLTNEGRKELSTERTKLSLYKPENYNSYFCKPIVKTMSASRMNAFSHEYPAFNLREHLPSMKTKTLIICGRHDVQCPIQYSIDMHEDICDSTFVHLRRATIILF